ncbi:MAG TPA: C25 family cysteine peptidase [Phycisphaerae bacterium]|nr:C25 family cysteine peptidase [Phycisphaerae bacterium]HNU44277.1 C25 family cysteine peptidase [Phycisphaerae bacterium]
MLIVRRWVLRVVAAAVGLAMVSNASAGIWLPAADGAGATPRAAQVAVVSGEATRLEVSCNLPGVELTRYDTPQGPFVLVTAPATAIGGVAGEPGLPVLRALFAAPDGVAVGVEVSAGPPTTVSLGMLGLPTRVMPVQAPVAEDAPPVERTRFHYQEAAYACGSVSGMERAVVRELGRMRGQRVFLLEVQPVDYEPLNGTLTVRDDVRVAISFSGQPAEGRRLEPLPGLNARLLNARTGGQPSRDTGNYLIVAAQAFAASAPLAQFASAKTAAGFDVTTYSVPPGTTAADIKTYIESQYFSANPPDYVLLVGDADAIPAWVGGGAKASPTDLPYVCMDGANDWYPDIALGRFSVRSEGQLQAVVDKTLHVAGGVFADPDFVRRAAFVAGPDDDCGDEDTHNWVIDTYLEPRDYLSNKLYTRTYFANPTTVRAALNEGSVYVIYYGHSDTNGWHAPALRKSDIRNLTNSGKYPFHLSISCNAGDFTVEECFGETWLIQANKGAAAVYAASEFLYWLSPPWTEAGDLEKFLFTALYDDGVREIGRAWQAVLLDLLAKYGPQNPVTRDYFEMFNLLGDPSLRVPMPNAFMLTVQPDARDVCAPPAVSASYTIEVGTVGDFAAPVTLSAAGQPAGTTVDFSINDLPAPFTTVMTVNALNQATPGNYALEITGAGGGLERRKNVRLGLASAAPGPVTLASPPDHASDVVLNPEFTWQSATQGIDYTLQVATDEQFTDVVYTANVMATSHAYPGEAGLLGHFYWRVRAGNGCGLGDFSEPFEFTTLTELVPAAYDMLNGCAVGFLDEGYNGDGDPGVPLALLRNGVGKLTDGIRATQHANNTPAPYVGWNTINPTITIHFGQPVWLGAVLVSVDGSGGFEAVFPPHDATLVMGGVTRQFNITEPPPGNKPFTVSFTNLDLTGDTLELTLADYHAGLWIMLSEIQCQGKVVQGACCQGGTCEVLSAPACATVNGEYQGDWTTCDPNPCAVYEPECLIISEVVMGAESGSCPRWIEITNTGYRNFSFLEGGIIVQTDGSNDVTVDVDLTGVTIAAGQAFVINSTQGGNCGGAFPFIYGVPADLETSAPFGDGNDRYILTDKADGSHLLDIYGMFGVDGKGTFWEYTDGYSYRMSNVNSGNGGVFDPYEWYYGGVGSLGPGQGNPTELLLRRTHPFVHTFDEHCGTPVPGDFDHDGDVDLADYGIYALCMGGPDNYVPPKECDPADFYAADLDADKDVDLGDFDLFTLAFTGEQR